MDHSESKCLCMCCLFSVEGKSDALWSVVYIQWLHTYMYVYVRAHVFWGSIPFSAQSFQVVWMV